MILHTFHWLLRSYGKPYRVNYIARYSLCKCIRPTFAQDIICAVYVSTYLASVFGAIETVSWSNPLSTKDMLFLIVRLIVRERVQIKLALLV